MKFQKGDILRRNKVYEEVAHRKVDVLGGLMQMTELYESVSNTNGDPLCIVVRSNKPERIGKKLFFSAEWVEIAEYS